MTLLNTVLNRIFDLLLAPFAHLNPWLGMFALALVTAVLLLLIFKFSSNAAVIRRRKDRAIGRVLEMAVYADVPSVSLSALGRVVRENAAYVATLWLPLCLSLVPLLLIAIQVHEWYGSRPLRGGETAALTVQFEYPAAALDVPVRLDSADSVFIETPGVRAPDTGEVSWRLRAMSPPGGVAVILPGGHVVKRVPIGDPPQRASAARVKPGFLNQLLAPSEPPLPADSPLARIALDLPEGRLPLPGASVHWLVAFFALSLLLALALARPLRVTV